MKAILVIDVDDCINVEPCEADVYVRFPFQSNGWVREYRNVSLKPMPTEKNTFDRKLAFDKIAEYIGWNKCLKEIEGD